jgi:hypothetical protein
VDEFCYEKYQIDMSNEDNATLQVINSVGKLYVHFDHERISMII